MKDDGNKRIVTYGQVKVTDVWGWVFVIADTVSFFIFLLAIGTRLALGINTAVVSGVVFFLFSLLYLARPGAIYKEHVIYQSSSKDEIISSGPKAAWKDSLIFTIATMVVGGGVAWFVSQTFQP